LTLVLETDQWLVVADEIRRGRCRVQALNLIILEGTRSEATEAVQALASAIRLDQNMEYIVLSLKNGFTDEAGVALAEALTVNTTLRKITLSTDVFGSQLDNEATLGAPAYEAFSAMLRVNTSLVLEVPPLDTADADERLHESREQMIIEQRLNQVGRGRLLASKQTTIEEYVDALHDLNPYSVNDSPAFQVSGLYSLLRLNPSIVCMA
jgi:hypothetical protein